MSEANYVGSYYDWDTDAVMIWERDENGRKVVAHHAPHYFYVDDVDGEYTSIFGQKLRKLEFETSDEMKAAQRSYPRRQIHESDIRPEAKVLMNEYYGRPTPNVHYAFLDIEVDYKSTLGFSSPENPYAPINAVTIYQSWTKEYLTYAVPPKGWDGEATFDADIARMWDEHKLGFKPNVVLCHNERELLNFLVAAIQDADIISGWNSEFFDLPYIIKRLLAIQPKLADKMSFIGCKPPKEGTVERFGSPAIVYTLYGRTHLDYLDLFKKFTFEGRTSYSLGNIAAEELDVPKLDYEGTLEQLYNRDFIHFITYNARDVEVLVKLDVKFKLIALVNQMAHENTVPFLAILGTVRYVETGIMNRAHNVHNLIAPDKAPFGGMNEKVEGAIVMDPHYGLHEWNGSVDLTSLYPTVIRMLNMSIETYVGTFSQEDIDWRGLMDDRIYLKNTARHFKKAGTRYNIRHRTAEMIAEDQQREYTAIMANGEEVTMTWKDWRRFIKENGIGVSAFGVMFDQNKVALVADTLTFWFAERKRLQAEKKKYGKLADAETDPVKKAEYEKLEEHYDLLQLTKKIQLNSTYGALLNEAFRFGRREIGASVTATGREITVHMTETIGELVTGEKTELQKYFTPEEGDDDEEGGKNHWWTDCDGVIYGDTDSCYFKTYATNKEEAVTVADAVAEQVNASFPAFAEKFFNVFGGRELLLKAAREIVGIRGLWLNAKKKYTIRVVDSEGKAVDKLKSMGSEIKKADTPKVIQDFLKGLMNLVLDGQHYEIVETFVNSKRGELIRQVKNVIDLGVAKQVNNLDALYAEWKKTEKVGKGKVKLSGHVRAAVNYNEMVTHFNSTDKQLRSGDKAITLYLMTNEFGFKSMAFPADMMHLPDWFTENFRVDKKITEEKMIDNKLKRIFEALDWDIPTPQKTMIKSILKF